MSQKFVDPRSPLTRPEWVRELNREGELWPTAGKLPDMVPLDSDSLLAAARRTVKKCHCGFGMNEASIERQYNYQERELRIYIAPFASACCPGGRTAAMPPEAPADGSPRAAARTRAIVPPAASRAISKLSLET